MRALAPSFLFAVLLQPWPGVGFGQTVYKSVDAQGNVTYSSTRPADAAKVQPIAVQRDLPSDAGAEDGRLRADVDRQGADEQRRRDEEKAFKAQRAAAVAQAEKRLKEAQDALETATGAYEAERKSLARDSGADGLGSYERVKAERRRVREAEQALDAAKAAPLPAPPAPQPQAQPQTQPQAQPRGATPPAGSAPAVAPDSRG